MQFTKRLIRVVHRVARGTETAPTFRVRRGRSSDVGAITARVLVRVRSISITTQAVATAAARSVRCSLSSTSY